MESINSCPFRFISAEIKSDGVECIIKNISEIKNTTFYIDNYKLDYYIQNDEYVLSIPKDEAEKIPFVFDLTAQIDTEEYKIHCWVIDNPSLEFNKYQYGDLTLLFPFVIFIISTLWLTVDICSLVCKSYFLTDLRMMILMRD